MENIEKREEVHSKGWVIWVGGLETGGGIILVVRGRGLETNEFKFILASSYKRVFNDHKGI